MRRLKTGYFIFNLLLRIISPGINHTIMKAEKNTPLVCSHPVPR